MLKTVYFWKNNPFSRDHPLQGPSTATPFDRPLWAWLRSSESDEPWKIGCEYILNFKKVTCHRVLHWHQRRIDWNYLYQVNLFQIISTLMKLHLSQLKDNWKVFIFILWSITYGPKIMVFTAMCLLTPRQACGGGYNNDFLLYLFKRNDIKWKKYWIIRLME